MPSYLENILIVTEQDYPQYFRSLPHGAKYLDEDGEHISSKNRMETDSMFLDQPKSKSLTNSAAYAT